MKEKKTYTYAFSTETGADSFLKELAKTNVSATVQHPLTDNKPQLKRVLVTGTGSLNYDLVLKTQMENLAKKYDGVLFPW